MIFSNFMSILYVVIIFVSIFFITYSVMKLKSFVSGPMTFKSEIDFKNAYTQRIDFAKELEALNIVSSWEKDDNITTFETLQLINIINSTFGKGNAIYDNSGGSISLFPALKTFPIKRRFFFVYNNGEWKIQEAEESLCTTTPVSMGAVEFFQNYIKDVYSFKSFEFPIFFRSFIGYIVVSDDVPSDYNIPI